MLTRFLTNKPTKFLIKFIIISTALIFVLVGLLFVSLQIESSKNFYIKTLNSSLTSSGIKLKMGKINGFFPFNWSVESLNVADKNDDWLEIKNLYLDWSPMSLFDGNLALNEVSATSIIIYHIPAFPKLKQQPKQPLNTQNESSLSITNLPFSINVNKLDVQQLFLAKALLIGSSKPLKTDLKKFLSLTINGQTSVEKNSQSNLLLNINHLDYIKNKVISAINLSEASHLSAHVNFNPKTKLLSLKTKIEIKQRLLAKLDKDILDLPEELNIGDIKISLLGDSPWDNWSGQLKLSIDRLASADSQIKINLSQFDKKISLALDNELLIAKELLDLYALPSELTQLKLDTVVDYVQLKEHLKIQKLALSSNFMQLNANGNIDLVKQHLDLETQLAISNLSELNKFLPEDSRINDLSGKLKLNNTINGNWNLPQISYLLEASNIVASGVKVVGANTKGSIKIIQNNTANQVTTEILVNTQGLLKQIKYQDLEKIPEQTINWNGLVNYSLDSTAKYDLAIKQFEVKSEILETSLTGDINTQTQLAKLNLKSILKDLSQFKMNPDFMLAGENKISAQLIMSEDARTIDLNLDSQFKNLAGLPSELMILLGNKPNITAKINLLEQDLLEIKSLKLYAEHTKLSSEAKVIFSTGELSAQINTQISDLIPLSEALPAPVSGAIEQQLTVTGTLEKPELLLILKGDKLFYNQYSLGKLNTEIDVTNVIDSPDGKIKLNLNHKQQNLSLNSQFQLKENIFYLSQLAFKAPSSKISGDLAINLKNNSLKGAISGQLKQLSKLNFLHQQENLAGDIDFNINMDVVKNTSNPSQQLSYMVNSKQLAYDDILLEQLTLSGDISGLNQQLAIDTQLDIKKIRFAKNTKKELQAKLSLTVKGNPDNIQIALKTATDNKENSLNISASIKQKDKNIMVLLQKLDGEVLKQPIKLRQQAKIKWLNQKQLEVEPLEIDFAQSTLKLAAELNQNKNNIRANLNVANFPLDMLAKLNIQQAELANIKGDANVDFSIQGNLSQPNIQFKTQIQQLSLHKGKHPKQLDLLLIASLKNNLSLVSLTVTGLTKKPILSSIELPLALSLLPYKLDSGKVLNQPLKGTLDADIDLYELSSWIELDQQLVEGHLIADMKLSGNINTPNLLGNISLSDGKYENAQSGTLIHDINMDIEATDQQLTIKKLIATDSEQGLIKGQGNILLNPSANQKFQFELDLDKAKLLRHDDMTMQLSGFIKLNGDKYRGAIKSQITVDKGEFFLPESTGADIPQLAVLEVNKEGENKSQKQKKSVSGAYPLDLDIAILVPSKMYVRGRGLESEWEGKILIKQQLSDPLLEGNLDIKRGYFNFMSHRFNFRKGNINFVGSLPPQPQLDFEMEAKGKEMTAILKISGDAEKPDIKLESEPMMPDDEILAQLLFNKDISEISGFEALQLASAIRTLTTGGSGMMDKTRGALGVDTIDFNGDEGTGGSVTVGKHISEDVYVEVISGMTSGDSQVKVEMDITDNISVESRVDQESNTGAGLNWKFDY